MALHTLVVFGASYGSQDDAVADYEAVKDFYEESGLIDTYDAAVVSRHTDGKVKIVKKHEQPTRQGAWGGLGIGLGRRGAGGAAPCGRPGRRPPGGWRRWQRARCHGGTCRRRHEPR